MKTLFAIGTLAALAGCAATPPLVADPATDPMLLRFAMGFMQGAIYLTGEPANLAISGDGFFIVSRTTTPKSWDDLVFTRDGAFRFDFTPGTRRDTAGNLVKGEGTWRVVNKDGMFVQGYAFPAIENQRPFGTPPEETHGKEPRSLDTVTLQDAPGQAPRAVPLQALALELATNPRAAEAMAFDQQGLLHVNGIEPMDATGQRTNMYVAIAKFQQVLGLRRMNGDFKAGNRLYLYQPAAGEVYAGVAGTGNSAAGKRPVGSSNALTPGAAEQPIPLDRLDDVFTQLRGAASH
jgi:hypothetical protein